VTSRFLFFQGFPPKIHSFPDSLIRNWLGFIGPNQPQKKVRNISGRVPNCKLFKNRIYLHPNHLLQTSLNPLSGQPLILKICFSPKIHNPQYPRPFYRAHFSVFSQRRHNFFKPAIVVGAMRKICMQPEALWPWTCRADLPRRNGLSRRNPVKTEVTAGAKRRQIAIPSSRLTCHAKLPPGAMGPISPIGPSRPPPHQSIHPQIKVNPTMNRITNRPLPARLRPFTRSQFRLHHCF